MNFITKDDLKLTTYQEILDVISREEPSFLDAKIELAIAEVDSYLNQKYDTLLLWSQTGNDRNRLIFNLTIDVALYHIYGILEEVPAIRQQRYEYAKTMLKDIMKGNLTISGLAKIKESDTQTTGDVISGNRERKY